VEWLVFTTMTELDDADGTVAVGGGSSGPLSILTRRFSSGIDTSEELCMMGTILQRRVNNMAGDQSGYHPEVLHVI